MGEGGRGDCACGGDKHSIRIERTSIMKSVKKMVTVKFRFWERWHLNMREGDSGLLCRYGEEN